MLATPPMGESSTAGESRYDAIKRNIVERKRDPDTLLPYEVFWRDLQPWLELHGYQLRPRYRPGWVPSWKTTGQNRMACEDNMASMVGYFSRCLYLFLTCTPQYGQVLDATRISDGELVVLKRLNRSVHPYEVEISKMFSEDPLKSHPRNHCVPVFEFLRAPNDDDVDILVLPLLRPFNNPRFESIGEAVEFFRQVFEVLHSSVHIAVWIIYNIFQGLQFIHQCHVAHRYAHKLHNSVTSTNRGYSDCMHLNIMMDARPMYPNMYHPREPTTNLNWKGTAKYHTRTARPVKYYFIDFGISRKYDANNTSPLEDPIMGGDKTVPEFQESTEPCNPFPTDIYCLGNMIREFFLEVRTLLHSADEYC